MTKRPSRWTGMSDEERRLFQAALRARGLDRRRPAGIPVTPGRSVGPLSFAQRRLWFFEQLTPDTPAYNDVYGIRFEGPLDVDALRRALDGLVERHDALRATFRLRGAEPEQLIVPPRPLELAVTELDRTEGAVDGERLQDLARAAAREAFDLSAGPLVRARLVRVGEADHVLMLLMHHIVSDGQSFMILFRELAESYAELVVGRTPDLGPVAIRYVDYAAWERVRLDEGALAQDLAWWTDRLAPPLPDMPLPRDTPRAASQGFRGAGLSRELPGRLSERLAALARRHDATIFMTVLSAFQVLLRLWGAERETVVGSPIATRGRPETTGAVGLFVNTLVLRTDIAGDPSFSELLSRVRATCHEAYAHGEAPFDEVVRGLGLPRDLSANPLFQVFVLQDSLPGTIEPVPGLRMTHEPLDNGFVRADLALWVLDEGGLAGSHAARGPSGDDRLSLRLQYDRDLFRPETIAGTMDQVVRVLELVAEDDSRTIAQLVSALAERDAARRSDALESRKAGARGRLRAARRVSVKSGGAEKAES